MFDGKIKNCDVTINSLPSHFRPMLDANLLSIIPCDFVEHVMRKCEDALPSEMHINIRNMVEASILSDKEVLFKDNNEIAIYIVKLSFIKPVMAIIKQLVSSEVSEEIKSHELNFMTPIATKYRGSEYV